MNNKIRVLVNYSTIMADPIIPTGLLDEAMNANVCSTSFLDHNLFHKVGSTKFVRETSLKTVYSRIL